MSADASIEMWTLLARTLRELWRDEAAFSAAERAVTIDPRDPLALAAKASALLGLHRFEEALRTAEAALTIDPTCLRARRIRAGVLARTGRTQEAIAQFDAILAGGSLDFDTLASKAGLLSQSGKPQEGVLLARNLLDMRPRSVQAHVLLSVALSFADEKGEALIVIDRAMRINASDFRIFVARGATYLAMGERSQARSAYDRAIALNPESRSLVQQRDNLLGGAGSAKSQLGNPETAEKAKRMITWSWIVAGAAFVWAVVMALSPSNTVGEGLSLFIVFLITYDAWSFFWGWAPTWRGWKNITDRIGISFSADPIVFLIVVVIVLFALCFIAATYGVFGGGIYHYLKTRRLARSA